MEETIDLRRLRSFDEIILAMKESMGKTFKLAFQASIPVMAGYVVMGIDFAMTAIFITIATDQWMKNKDHRSAIIGFVISLACLINVSHSILLLAVMIIITYILRAGPFVIWGGKRKVPDILRIQRYRY